jgi:hypothetical protein
MRTSGCRGGDDGPRPLRRLERSPPVFIVLSGGTGRHRKGEELWVEHHEVMDDISELADPRASDSTGLLIRAFAVSIASEIPFVTFGAEDDRFRRLVRMFAAK